MCDTAAKQGADSNPSSNSNAACDNAPTEDVSLNDIVNPNDWGLDEIQVYAISMTVSGMNDSQVARELGIERRTIWRWKTANPDYRAALHDARQQKYSTIGDRFNNIAREATDVLTAMLRDASAFNRYRAAQALLQMAGRFKPGDLKSMDVFKMVPPSDAPPFRG